MDNVLPHMQAVLDEFAPYLRSVAERRAHRGELRVISIDEWEPLPVELRRSLETSYRRGYLHGYGQALDDACTAHPGTADRQWWRKLCNHFDNRLRRWRMRNHEGAIEMPPYFRRTEREPEANA